MRQNRAKWEGGIGRWREILRAVWPRSRIPPERRRTWSYPSPPSLLSSRLASAIKVSRTQSENVPVPRRSAACRAALWSNSACSGRTRARISVE